MTNKLNISFVIFQVATDNKYDFYTFFHTYKNIPSYIPDA